MAFSDSNLYLVVIAGGSGTRFWPKSTSKKPKQLLSFGSTQIHTPSQSLLSQTMSRFDGWIPQNRRIIVTTESLKKAILEDQPEAEILAEPQGRNTAPCIYWAAQHIHSKNPNGVMLIMPADHYIARPSDFVDSVRKGAEWASRSNDLVTLGIRPSRPETGYGYLRIQKSHSEKLPKDAFSVEAFVEKPNAEKAKAFLDAGNYLWNGGMFLWKTKVILEAFDEHMPEMRKAWENARGNVENAYPSMTATSIDYGVMEKAKNVITFPLECGWDDLGNWTSLESMADVLHARQGENIVTSGDVISIESRGNIVDVPNRLVALLGAEDLIIVEQGEALLIAKKDAAQNIRSIVEAVKEKRPDLA